MLIYIRELVLDCKTCSRKCHTKWDIHLEVLYHQLSVLFGTLVVVLTPMLTNLQCCILLW